MTTTPQDHLPSRAAAEALRARGIPITLATGETVRLRYSMDALEQLEADFGNIGNVLTEMKGAEQSLGDSLAVAAGDATPEQQQRHQQAQGKVSSLFGIIRRALLPGLADATATHPRTLEPFMLEDDKRAAAQLLDASRLHEYVDAFSQAFSQAFYAGGSTPPVAPAPTTPGPGPALSHGSTGGMSAPSSGTAPMPSSGA